MAGEGVVSEIFLYAVYAVVCVGIGLVAARDKSAAHWHTGGRTLGVFGVLAGVFTLIGAGEYVTMTALTYAFGSVALLLFAGVAGGMILLGFLAPIARRDAAARDMHSIPDFLEARFGRAVSSVAAAYSLIVLGCLLVIQFIVGGMMIAALTGWALSIAALLCAGVVSAYVLLGGFASVSATDKIQAGFLALLATGWLVFADQAGAMRAFCADLDTVLAHPLPGGTGVVLFVSGILAVLGGADFWQRLMMARDDKSAVRGFCLGAAALFAFGVFIYWLALSIRAAHPEIDPDMAFMVLLEGLPPFAAGLIGLTVFSSILSTADTELFTMTVIAEKALGRSLSSVRRSRIVTAAIVIAACVLALFFQNLTDIYMTLLYIFIVVGSVCFPSLLGRGSRVTALIGLIGGGAVLAGLYGSGLLAASVWAPLLLLVPALPCWIVRKAV